MRTNPIWATAAIVAIVATVATLASVSAAAVLPAATPARGPAPPAPAPAAAALSKTDQNIVTAMAQGTLAQIALGKMALGKSQNAQVKTYAQQMIDDHTSALGAVRQLAAARRLRMPADLDTRHKAMAGKLDAKSGDAFDKAYMAQGGVAGHQNMHSMLASAERTARDPNVKALAAKMLPTVDQHLKAARRMASHKDRAPNDKPSSATGAGK